MQDLVDQYEKELKQQKFKDLLNDQERVKYLQFRDIDNKIMLDCSHTKINKETLNIFEKLLEQKEIYQKKQKQFQGDIMNITEKRSVLHTALRAPKDQKILVNGKNVVEEVHSVLEEIKEFSDKVRNGDYLGYSNKRLTKVLLIGIGGSYLSIEFVYEALRLHPEYTQKGREMRFLANVDPIDFKKSVQGLDVEETIVIVNSKTFTTAETMLNAHTVRDWILTHYNLKEDQEKAKECISKHVVACSTNLKACQDFGIRHIFRFWDWVGGRFSVSSAIGVVPLSLYFGFHTISQFLKGQHDMDKQFLENPLCSNLPTLLALIGYYNTQILQLQSRAIIPYCQALSRFVAHIQQMDMESNGKQCSLSNQLITDPNCTGSIIFGEPGTNSQHSFFQLLHQGRTVAVEFIGYCKSQHEININGIRNHDELMSNFFSQPDALAVGKSRDELEKEGVSEELLNAKIFKGDRGSISILFKEELNAFNCGQLLSMYEHRVSVEGWLLGVNSYDQMGVELGKVLATNVRAVLQQKHYQNNQPINQSTRAILDFYFQANS